MAKKKIKKEYERILICIIGVLIVFLILSFFKSSAILNPYYKIASRVSKYEESKKLDNDNYETVGWLKVQGSKIDLPILKSSVEYPEEMEEYAWTMAKDTKYHNVMVIMGHNIFNLGTSPTVHSDSFHRFEDIMSFIYHDVAKENLYFQYTVDGETYLYKIFAASFLYDSDIYLLPRGDYSKEEVNDYIDLFKKTSIYKYDVDVDENDDFITLTTCTRFFGKRGVTTEFALAGRKVRDGEVIDQYKVEKTDRYEKVDAVLKGEKNEDKSV